MGALRKQLDAFLAMGFRKWCRSEPHDPRFSYFLMILMRRAKRTLCCRHRHAVSERWCRSENSTCAKKTDSCFLGNAKCWSERAQRAMADKLTRRSHPARYEALAFACHDDMFVVVYRWSCLSGDCRVCPPYCFR